MPTLLSPLTFAGVLGASASPAAPPFARSFAAAEGLVQAAERPYRQEVCLNGTWRFQPIALPPSYVRNSGVPPTLPAPTSDGWSATPVKVPSPWNVNRWTVQGRGDAARPYRTDSVYYPSYPREWDGTEMGWLRRSFRVPAGWGNRRVRLRFEAVAGECEVFVNGKRVGGNFDSFLPFEIDVTEAVRQNAKGRGAENELRVGVRDMRLWNHTGRKVEAFRAPYPPGSILDHITGIWQDVSLLGVPAVRVAETSVQPRVGRGVLTAEVTLRNDTGRARTVAVGGTVSPWRNLAPWRSGAPEDVPSAPEPRGKLGAAVLRIAPKSVVVPARGEAKVTMTVGASGLKTWSPDAPNLYGLVLDVGEGGRTLDRQSTRFGWREFKIAGRDLLLNGRKITLYGDLLHPFGPFIGSRRYVWSWYRMIQAMGGNAVRPHGQPHPRAYLDLADEMGICVLDETALFGSSIQMDLESPEAWRRFEDHYDRLVVRDRNHPSVFGWSLGNELFALLLKVPEAERGPYYDRLKRYARRSFTLDPTREWVSCDGDGDLRGGVPVWSAHHGTGLPKIPESAGPRMIGESGGSYYAKPGELARFNGDRAYENYRGRNEALAIDLYRNITEMAKPNDLAFFAASETAWFGLEHLPLGLDDPTRPPTIADGVRFGPHREGEPGAQPERLPPYCMTFNPGFDPALPLYRPLPMFEAFRDALAGRPLAWGPAKAVAPSRAIARIWEVSFAGDRGGGLGRRLAGFGVPLSDSAPPGLMVVDGDAIGRESKSRIDAALAGGGTVLVAFGAGGDVGALAPGVSFTARTATGLRRVGESDVTAGLGLADLTFAEDAVDPRIARRGLTGAFVTLLAASETDWTLFNDLSEEEKCSNLLIYEAAAKPSGAILVEVPVGRGRLLLSTIDYGAVSPGRVRLWRALMANLGVALGAPSAEATALGFLR